MNLYIVGTPLHLYNACELACCEYPSDYNVFLISSDISYAFIWMVEIVKKAGIHIGVIDEQKLNCQGVNLIPKTFLTKLFKARLFPRRSNASYLDGLDIDRIIIFSPNAMSAYLTYKHPNAEVVLGEDGLGTYTGGIYERLFFLEESFVHSPSLKKGILIALNQSIFSRKLTLRPETIYLHQPPLSCCQQPCAISKISRSKKWDEVLNALSRNNNVTADEAYNTADVVFLGIPGESKQLIRARDDVIAVLETNNIHYVYRKHPRERFSGENSSKGLWELRCINEISDDTLLLSAFSTAAFSPKLYFGKEPTLIFFYPLVEKMGGALANANELVDALRGTYSDKNKVIVADSLAQLIKAINKHLAY